MLNVSKKATISADANSGPLAVQSIRGTHGAGKAADEMVQDNGSSGDGQNVDLHILAVIIHCYQEMLLAGEWSHEVNRDMHPGCVWQRSIGDGR